MASSIVAVVLALRSHVRLDLRGTSTILLVVACLLLMSRLWWERQDKYRIADGTGVIATTSLGGMTCGAIAMLELRLHFRLADAVLQSWDHRLGVDGLEIVRAILSKSHRVFYLMAPAYNFTIAVFFGGLIALALMGDRIEAWRSAFCFVGALLTTCIIAAFFPAKGIGVWAPDSLIAALPPNAMRNFWPHFDEFYFNADPVLRLQVIDGVISFPSFHTVVGFLVLAMWRKNRFTFAMAFTFLVFMLLGTFPGGGHYVVDLVGGFTVWVTWFALSWMIERSCPKVCGPAG